MKRHECSSPFFCARGAEPLLHSTEVASCVLRSTQSSNDDTLRRGSCGVGAAGRGSDGFAALVDSIYEAAFCPENWNDVLADVGAASGSASGLLMVFDGARPVGFRATPVVYDVIKAAAASRDGPNPRAAFSLKNPFRGFVIANDYLPPEILNSDHGHARRLAIGLDSEASSVTIMPTGELVVFSFDRWRREGPHREQHLATLNALVSPSRADRPRCGSPGPRARRRRHGGAADDRPAGGRPHGFRKSVVEQQRVRPADWPLSRPAPSAASRSPTPAPIACFRRPWIPPRGRSGPFRWPKSEERPACVLHVLPLRRNAHDLFSGGDTLIAVTTLRTSSSAPSRAVLGKPVRLHPVRAVFRDRIDGGPDGGVRRREKCGLTLSSGRTYLARIFAKTGTHRQAELIALLASTHPFEHRP